LDNNFAHLTNHTSGSKHPEFSNELTILMPEQLAAAVPGLELSTLRQRMNEIAAGTMEAMSKVPLPVFYPFENTFEIFGFDFLVDDDMRVWLLEVNGGTNFDAFGHNTSRCERLFRDTLQVIGLEEAASEDECTQGTGYTHVYDFPKPKETVEEGRVATFNRLSKKCKLLGIVSKKTNDEWSEKMAHFKTIINEGAQEGSSGMYLESTPVRADNGADGAEQRFDGTAGPFTLGQFAEYYGAEQAAFRWEHAPLANGEEISKEQLQLYYSMVETLKEPEYPLPGSSGMCDGCDQPDIYHFYHCLGCGDGDDCFDLCPKCHDDGTTVAAHNAEHGGHTFKEIKKEIK